MAVFAYIRVSTEMQTHSNQKYEISNWCRHHGFAVKEWVSESISGTVAVEKRNLGSLLERMEKGDLLICTELSRLGRNMLMIMGILNLCAEKGISIHSIKDNFDLSEDKGSTCRAQADGVRLGRPPGRSVKKDAFLAHLDEVRTLKSKGKSYVEIATAYGIHRNTLRKYLKDTGV